jgi:hypothetical protein
MVYGWSPNIADPTALGWFTVAAYLLAAGLCWGASRRDRRSASLWHGMFAMLVLLGIGLHLDFQSLPAAIGRHASKEEYWYGAGRNVLHDLALVLLAAAIACAIWAFYLTRHRSGGLKIATVGFFLLFGFIVVRAASLHGMDALLRTRAMELLWNHVPELGGIVIIGSGAALARKPPRYLHIQLRRQWQREIELADPDWLHAEKRKPGKARRRSMSGQDQSRLIRGTRHDRRNTDR